MAPAAPAAVPWLFFRVRGLPCQFVAHLFFLEFCVTFDDSSLSGAFARRRVQIWWAPIPAAPSMSEPASLPRDYRPRASLEAPRPRCFGQRSDSKALLQSLPWQLIIAASGRACSQRVEYLGQANLVLLPDFRHV